MVSETRGATKNEGMMNGVGQAIVPFCDHISVSHLASSQKSTID
jgi:hypothetical protein